VVATTTTPRRNNRRRKRSGQARRPNRRANPAQSIVNTAAYGPTFTYLNPKTGNRPPWGGCSNSVGMCVVTRVDVATDANGAFATYINPGLLHNNRHSTTVTSGSVTAIGTTYDCTSYDTIGSDFAQFRMVSASIEFMFTYNDYNNEGLLSFKTFVQNATMASMLSGDQLPTSKGSLSLSTFITPVKTGGYCYPVIVNMVGARNFYDIDGTTQLLGNYTSTMIMVSGAKASTTIGEIVICQNIEIIPYAKNITARVAKPSIPENPIAVTAARRAMDHLLTTTKNLGTGAVEKAITTATAYAGRAAAGAIVGLGQKMLGLGPTDAGWAQQGYDPAFITIEEL